MIIQKTVKAPIKYNQLYREGRQRTDRIREVTEQGTITINVIASSDAPISGYVYDEYSSEKNRTLRLINDRLYANTHSYNNNTDNQNEKYIPTTLLKAVDNAQRQLGYEEKKARTADEIGEKITEKLEKNVFIEGIEYEPIDEPIYKANFGSSYRGRGNYSAYITISSIDQNGKVKDSHGYDRAKYFNAGELEQAREWLKLQIQDVKTSEYWQGTEIQIQDPSHPLTVLIPEHFRFGKLYEYESETEITLTLRLPVQAAYEDEAREKLKKEVRDLWQNHSTEKVKVNINKINTTSLPPSPEFLRLALPQFSIEIQQQGTDIILNYVKAPEKAIQKLELSLPLLERQQANALLCAVAIQVLALPQNHGPFEARRGLGIFKELYPEHLNQLVQLFPEPLKKANQAARQPELAKALYQQLQLFFETIISPQETLHESSTPAMAY